MQKMVCSKQRALEHVRQAGSEYVVAVRPLCLRNCPRHNICKRGEGLLSGKGVAQCVKGAVGAVKVRTRRGVVPSRCGGVQGSVCVCVKGVAWR